jgi:hypothetical protein
MARRAVQHELAAQGRRTPWAEVLQLAQAYRAAHETELLVRAAEMVRRNPTLTAMAAQEERQRIREERKRARAGVIENPSVCTSDHAKSTTENTTEKAQLVSD